MANRHLFVLVLAVVCLTATADQGEGKLQNSNEVTVPKPKVRQVQLVKKPKACPKPNALLHGSVKLVNDKAVYSCKKGYRLTRAATRICQDGKWSGKAPICRGRLCRTPRPILYGSVKIQHKGRVVQYGRFPSSATYTCGKGFVLLGNSTHRCKTNGRWAGKLPGCQGIKCNPVSEPLNGHIHYTNGGVFPGDAVYSCKRGHVLKGTKKRTCLSSGQWTEQAPVCPPVQCKVLKIANGTVSYSDKKGVYKSKATYACKPGYDLVGKAGRRCKASGKWSGKKPVCQPKVCGAPLVPYNGKMNFTNKGVYPSTATYKCKRGYKRVSGDRVRTCGTDGRWTGTLPVCEGRPCLPRAKNLTNGAMDVSNNGKYPSTITYVCKDGFKLKGRPTRKCTAKGLWATKKPRCVGIKCHRIVPTANLRMKFSSKKRRFPGTVKFSCPKGYKLVGEKKARCTTSGEWTADMPACQKISVKGRRARRAPRKAKKAKKSKAQKRAEQEKKRAEQVAARQHARQGRRRL